MADLRYRLPDVYHLPHFFRNSTRSTFALAPPPCGGHHRRATAWRLPCTDGDAPHAIQPTLSTAVVGAAIGAMLGGAAVAVAVTVIAAAAAAVVATPAMALVLESWPRLSKARSSPRDMERAVPWRRLMVVMVLLVEHSRVVAVGSLQRRMVTAGRALRHARSQGVDVVS